jgi:hypothetical protein
MYYQFLGGKLTRVELPSSHIDTAAPHSSLLWAATHLMLLVLGVAEAPSCICRSSLPCKQLACSIQRELVLLVLFLLLQRHNRSASVGVPGRHREGKLLLLQMQLLLLCSKKTSSRVIAAMLRHHLLLPLQKHLLRSLLLLLLQLCPWAVPE